MWRAVQPLQGGIQVSFKIRKVTLRSRRAPNEDIIEATLSLRVKVKPGDLAKTPFDAVAKNGVALLFGHRKADAGMAPIFAVARLHHHAGHGG